MTYIDYLNQFWKIRRTRNISPTEADLYYCLLQESNARGWENPFEYSNGLICATIGINERTMIDARNRLQQKGLIRFQSGLRRHRSPVYTLLNCNFYSKNVSINDSINNGISDGINDRIIRHSLKDKEEDKERTSVDVPRKRFKRPTLEEVTAYCLERQNGVDPGRFTDYYQARGWKIGNTVMRDWKAAVRTWESHHKNEEPNAHAVLVHTD